MNRAGPGVWGTLHKIMTRHLMCSALQLPPLLASVFHPDSWDWRSPYTFDGVMACFGRLMRRLPVESSCEEIFYVIDSLNNWGWRDTLRSLVSSPAPCLKHSKLHQIAQGLVHLSFEYLQGWWCQPSLGIFLYLSTLIVRKNTVLYPAGISHVSACVHCLFYHCSSPRRVWLCLL